MSVLELKLLVVRYLNVSFSSSQLSHTTFHPLGSLLHFSIPFLSFPSWPQWKHQTVTVDHQLDTVASGFLTPVPVLFISAQKQFLLIIP